MVLDLRNAFHGLLKKTDLSTEDDSTKQLEDWGILKEVDEWSFGLGLETGGGCLPRANFFVNLDRGGTIPRLASCCRWLRSLFMRFRDSATNLVSF
jgi:hypothetical protein